MNRHTNRHHYEEWVVDTLKELISGSKHLVEVPKAILEQQPYHRPSGVPYLKAKAPLGYYDFAQHYTYLLELAAKADDLAWELHQQAVKAHNGQWETHGKAEYAAKQAEAKQAEAAGNAS